MLFAHLHCQSTSKSKPLCNHTRHDDGASNELAPPHGNARTAGSSCRKHRLGTQLAPIIQWAPPGKRIPNRSHL